MIRNHPKICVVIMNSHYYVHIILVLTQIHVPFLLLNPKNALLNDFFHILVFISPIGHPELSLNLEVVVVPPF